MLYSAERPTKFGVYADDLKRAVEVARTHGLTIDTVHFHVANGLLDEDLAAFDYAATAVASMVEHLIDLGCPIAEINAGGGLGIAYHPGQKPLDLDAYVGILKNRLGHFGAVLSWPKWRLWRTGWGTASPVSMSAGTWSTIASFTSSPCR